MFYDGPTLLALVLEVSSWQEVTLSLGMALNATLSALILQRRVSADKRGNDQYDMVMRRLDAVEDRLDKCTVLEARRHK